MSSMIYQGSLWHKRTTPKLHEFSYPAYFYIFDLSQLENQSKQSKLFSYNRWSIASIHDQDYLKQGRGSISEKLTHFLRQEGIEDSFYKVELVTSARYFGYVFNPVSFYLCYRDEHHLACSVAEVRNTFGEMHLYLLNNEGESDLREGVTYTTKKEFHVSPFFDRQGQYRFHFQKDESSFSASVDLYHDQDPVLLSNLKGQAFQFSDKQLLKTLIRFPLNAALTIPRIHWQALLLYFKKKIRAYRKPPPLNNYTIRVAKPTGMQKIYQKLIFNFLNKIKKGSLRLRLPDGEEKLFGEIKEPDVTIYVHHYQFFKRLVWHGGIGLGEGYVHEDWSSSDDTKFLRLLIQNKPYFSQKTSVWNQIGDRWNRFYHLKRRNTIVKSRQNIQDHYDLSNDLYSLFLDPSYSYSCGIYETPEATLYEAQELKMKRLIEKLNLGSNDHVLEIGFGWGALAIKAVKETGCRWTGITLSEEQLALAKSRVSEQGLEDRIELKLCDYRHLEGQFDRIVSCEMIEAVGHEYLTSYFECLESHLKPDGLVVIQAITIPEERYESYRRGCDWIQKHIFPGGHLPSLKVLCDKMTDHTKLFVEDLENIGPHYATTLKDWRDQFLSHQSKVKELGFSEDFIRKWSFYFSYCEAAFAEGYLHDLQIVMSRNAKTDENLKRIETYAFK